MAQVQAPIYQPPQYAPPLPVDQGERSYNEVYNHQGPVQEEHKGSWTHEAIAAAAGFAAMKAWESHVKASGQEPTHEVMKETLAAIAAAEVDKLVETKGLDWVDKERAQHDAVVQAQHYADQRYGATGTGWEHAQAVPQPQEYAWPGNYGPAPYAPAYGMAGTGWGRPGGFGAGYGPLMGYGPLTDRIGMAVDGWENGGRFGMRRPLGRRGLIGRRGLYYAGPPY